MDIVRRLATDGGAPAPLPARDRRRREVTSNRKSIRTRIAEIVFEHSAASIATTLASAAVGSERSGDDRLFRQKSRRSTTMNQSHAAAREPALGCNLERHVVSGRCDA